MPRTKQVWTLVWIDEDGALTDRVCQDDDELKVELEKITDASKVVLFRGEPVPFAVKTETIVRIGKQAPAPTAKLNRDGSVRKKPGRKPKVATPINGTTVEATEAEQ